MTKEQYISAYLERIQYQGSTEPCLETLINLQRHHLYSVPFENLDILGDFTPSVDRDCLFDKIVVRRRGGVCYELNSSFYYLLTALGFSACQISGRGLMDLPLTGHVFTLVHLEEGDYTADVGYGDNPVPVMNVRGRDVAPGYSYEYWLEDDADGLLTLYQRRPGGEPQFQYQFSLAVRTPEDYMDTFRFSAAPGNTVFSQRPICCRFDPEGRTTLRHGVLSIEKHGQVVESRPIPPGEETVRCLREYFNLP